MEQGQFQSQREVSGFLPLLSLELVTHLGVQRCRVERLVFPSPSEVLGTQSN